MSTLKFTASGISFHEDAETQILSFADNPEEPSAFVIIQRSTEVSDQDINLGFDNPHFQIGESSSAYVQGATFKLTPQVLEITLPEKAARKLGGVNLISLSLPQGYADLETLNERLAMVLGEAG